MTSARCSVSFSRKLFGTLKNKQNPSKTSCSFPVDLRQENDVLEASIRDVLSLNTDSAIDFGY